MLKKSIFGTGLIVAISLASNVAYAADVNNGKTLHQSKCYQCHALFFFVCYCYVIYTRSDRKVNDAKRLKSMVSMCNTQLRLDLFPEDEADLVAYLNQQFYKFK